MHSIIIISDPENVTDNNLTCKMKCLNSHGYYFISLFVY